MRTFCSLILIVFLATSCSDGSTILLVVDNYPSGKYVIEENSQVFQEPYANALKNYDCYEYTFENKKLYVKDISIFRNLSVQVGKEWVEPVQNYRLRWISDRKIELEIGPAP